jgi:hypothetical protein
MDSRFKTLYGKPKTLTDSYDECDAEFVASLLAKREEQMGWQDFGVLYRVGVAPATYEEGLWFVPEAFEYLRQQPEENACNCIAAVMWFISEHASRLQADRLLDDCRQQVQALLAERTRDFVVLHWDRDTHPELGLKKEYRDYVRNLSLVEQTIESLLHSRTLRGWPEKFLGVLLAARGEPIRSAWYLTLIDEAAKWPFYEPPAEPSAERIRVERQMRELPGLGDVWDDMQRRFTEKYPPQLLPERALLEYHAGMIRHSGGLFAEYPTYWRDLFRKLKLLRGLSD